MDSKDSRLTTTSMPSSSLDYASDGQYEPCTENSLTLHKTSKQLQHGPTSRPSGLLGKMFRKGPPKHPRLNPVGISSKDFFSADPPLPPPPNEHNTPTKASKLARKLSSLSSSPHLPTDTPNLNLNLATSPQSLTPKSAIIPAFSSSAAVSSLGCLSDSDTMDDSVPSTPVMAYAPASSRRPTQQQRQRLDRSLPQIGRSAGYEMLCDSFGTAEQPQRRRPSRLKLDAVHVLGRAAASSDMRLTPSPLCQPRSSDASSPRDTATVSPSALLTMYADAERGPSAGESRKRGALWRAKLSFTNLRRPESRRQRHQSFDSNSVDISFHPRMYAESPLVSVPSTAPASARSRSPGAADYEQHKLDEFFGMSASPRFAQSPSMPGSGYSGTADPSCGDVTSVDGLGTIDRDFLLTIQRNSALEARRQRRRETRRNTMSFLSPANISSPPHEATSLVPVTAVDFALESASASLLASPPPSAAKPCLGQSRDENQKLASRLDNRAACNDIGGECMSRNCRSGETAGHEARCAGGLEGSNGDDTMSVKGPPNGTRPTSLDSLTYSEQAVAGSSRPSSSQPGSNGCGISQTLVLDDLCGDSRLHRPPQPQPPPDSSCPPSHHGAAAHTYCSSKGVDSYSCVPPVPPLPIHIAPGACHQRGVADSGVHSDTLVRPVTANACGSPRFVADTRRYRGSASVLPTMAVFGQAQKHFSPAPQCADMAPPPLGPLNSPMDAALVASSWDAEAIRLQRYCVVPGSGRHYPDSAADSSSSTLAAEPSAEGLAQLHTSTAKHSSPPLPLSAHTGRKFSQPDTQAASMSRPLASPMQSPSTFSKSTPHINTRSSVDGNKPNTAKQGIGRLFSATPPGRKSHLGPHHHISTSPAHSVQQLLPPTSPTVSSLVGDPMARRKIRDQLASSRAFDRLLEEDDEFTMAISLTPSVAGLSSANASPRRR